MGCPTRVPDPVISPADIFERAQRISQLHAPSEIVTQMCREALDLTGGHVAFASYVRPGHHWSDATHVVCDQSGHAGAQSPRGISATYALFRQVSLVRRPARMNSDEHPT